jgi:hypothetical protein
VESAERRYVFGEELMVDGRNIAAGVWRNYGLHFAMHSRLRRPSFALRESDPSPQLVSVALSPCHTLTPGTFSPGMFAANPHSSQYSDSYFFGPPQQRSEGESFWSDDNVKAVDFSV